MTKRQRILLSFAAAGALLGFVLWFQGPWASTAHAATTATDDYFASSSGSGSTCSQAAPCLITTALGAAANGDTIYVEEGTYTGHGPSVITITKSITLYGGWDGVGTGGVVRDADSYPTTLDGEYDRRVIFVNSDITPTIDGFIITRGSASQVAHDTGYGGGIYSDGATPIIANNTISGNVARASSSETGAGGGIYVHKEARGQIVISGNSIYSNTANTAGYGYGGGVYLGADLPEPSRIVYNTFLSNTASITGGIGYGGGLFFDSDRMQVMSNTFEYNVAQLGLYTPGGSAPGGGIYVSNSNDAIVANNVVRYNSAAVDDWGAGGGIGVYSSDGVSIVSNTLRYNHGVRPGGTGYGSQGGGLYVTESADMTIDRNVIVSNTARYGGGMHLRWRTSFTMTNNIVAENQADFEGGGLAFTASATNGVTGTIAHNTFAANNLGSGAGRNGIQVSDPGIVLALTNNIVCTHQYGIAIGDTGSSASLEHTLFFNNTTADTYSEGTLVNANPLTGQNPILDFTYHLMDGSPAILAGLTLGWPAQDIDGETRRLAAPDIGADDHQYPLDYQVYLPLVLRSY